MTKRSVRNLTPGVALVACLSAALPAFAQQTPWDFNGTAIFNTNTGNVGIGTTTPQAKLHVFGNLRVDGARTIVNGFDPINHWFRAAGPEPDSVFLSLRSADGVKADSVLVAPRGQVGVFVNFLGNVGVGTVAPAAKLDVAGTTRTSVLQITGGADLAEPFEVQGGDRVLPGSVVSIDPEHPGHLRISAHPYDRTVVGVVSGAGGVRPGMVMGQAGTTTEGGLPVAMTGRVFVLADASAGSIEPGDLLTTSPHPGRAMRVADHDRANGAILGKAMTGLAEGQGLVLAVVALQ